ncbi:MAG: hypothetical protein ACPGVH_00730 [Chitinophagales bacterium]
MDKNEHLENLKDIKALMERSSRFISLSGLSGIFAGTFALLGAAAVYYKYFGSFSIAVYKNRFPMNITVDFVFFGIIVALIVLILSISCSIFFTTKKARKQGLALWDETAFKTIINLLIPLFVGGVFCLILMYHSIDNYSVSYKMFGLVAPTTLVFYGLALLNAGKYTLDEIRYLGISEIVLGLFGCIFIGYGLLFWCLGFGVLHIVYGFLMWWKYEKD